MVVTRFAPSPTGYLHIGGLRTALFNFLYARANNGKFLLRIEDTDFNRNSIDASNAIIEAFNWVGLNYDNKDIVYQSKRLSIYKEYINKLLETNKAYYCYMTKEELDVLRENQRLKGLTPRYDNRYRDFTGIPPSNIKPVVRIKAPLEGSITFEDKLKGKITIQASELDDYIIARSDGVPTYNFVVAIDDALMKITDVIRGDDHLVNTAKQILIYKSLGFKVPNFCHIPMILNAEGKKLSKRDGALNVMEYKDMGYLPEALLNFLLRLGFSYKDKEIFSLTESIELFNLESLSSSPSSFNENKLLWLNNYYLKLLDIKDFEKFLGVWTPPLFIESIENINYVLDRKKCLYDEVTKRCNTFIECKKMIETITNIPIIYDNNMLAKLDNKVVNILIDILNEIEEKIRSNLDNTLKQDINFISYVLEIIDNTIHNFSDKFNIKSSKFLFALRLALLGTSDGISVTYLILILGIIESKNRINKFLNIVN